MPLFHQALNGLWAHISLYIKTKVAIYFPARGITSCLRLLFIDQHSQKSLQMTLGLHIPAHYPKAHLRNCFAVHLFGQEGRNDRMEGALITSDHIR